MIWESCYWKEPLIKLTQKLKRWNKQRTWAEERLVNLEREIFISFYSIRKLMDACKLSDSTVSMEVNLFSYPNKGQAVTLVNWDCIDNLYDLGAKFKDNQKLRYVCNQIIHRYVFMPTISDCGILENLLFCSDKERNNKLHELELEELIKIFCTVGKDYPSSGSYTFNPKKQDYEVTNS